ncbi:LysR family transcriptional regulator [Neptunomonas sp.]|uniref:LysR family transcriptional regulator n=1 Tax=Neptunomonas sp. TaxID=1971898 RepID=UPI00356A817F
MELQQLRLFLAAAESESFTRGAERAFVSQPALSASISKLEAEMGVKLFTRNKRNVVLTPAGRMLLKRAEVIVDECSRAKDELRRHDELRVLRLGVINTLSIHYVTRLVEQYRRENPGLVLNVTDANSLNIEKLEREERIDLALTILPPPPLSSRKFVYDKELFSEAYVVAMSQDHHLSKSPSLSIDDLIKEPFISRSHCEHRRVIQELLKSRNVRLNSIYVTDQDDRALALVKAGIGIAIVPEHCRSAGIRTCPLVESKQKRSIGFMWGQSENKDEITRFVDFASAIRWD